MTLGSPRPQVTYQCDTLFRSLVTRSQGNENAFVPIFLHDCQPMLFYVELVCFALYYHNIVLTSGSRPHYSSASQGAVACIGHVTDAHDNTYKYVFR